MFFFHSNLNSPNNNILITPVELLLLLLQKSIVVEELIEVLYMDYTKRHTVEHCYFKHFVAKRSFLSINNII